MEATPTRHSAHPAPPPATVPAGPAVPGYALHERLGAGAGSVVWRATRCADGREVAVKLVTPRHEGDRCVREFEVLRRLSVEGLVRVHEAFSLPGEPACVAVVLDLVRGGSLAAVLEARGHLSAGEAVTVVTPVARTLADLHARGVVHADLSPGNVLLERTGRPLLADLGVARLVGEAPAEIFGTPGFTAPEVETGEQPTSASDVYAVGALAWMCATGEPPAPLGVRRPLAELAPGLPPAWLEVVGQCLSPVPSERPPATEVALRLYDATACEPLRLVAGDDEVSLITHRLRAATPAGAGAPDEAQRSDLRRPAGRRPTLRRLTRWRPPLWRAGRRSSARLVVGALLCLALAVPAVLLGGRSPGRPDRAEAAQPASDASRPPLSRSATSVASTVAAPVLQDRASPRSRPRELMQALADTRAAVLLAGDDQGLSRLDVPGSAAWQADARLLRELRGSGERYEGLRFVVRTAEPASLDGDRSALRAVVDTGDHDVVGPGSARTPRPAERGAPLVVHLRWSDGRWRVESIAAGG